MKKAKAKAAFNKKKISLLALLLLILLYIIQLFRIQELQMFKM